MARRPKQQGLENPGELALRLGKEMVASHPLFAPLSTRASFVEGANSSCPPDGWALVTSRGIIHLANRRAEAAEWARVIGHCLLHLGFEHFQERENEQAWNAACDCVVEQFLDGLKFGRAPEEIRLLEAPPNRDVEQLYRSFAREGVPRGLSALGTGGRVLDMWRDPTPLSGWDARIRSDWPRALQRGIEEAVNQSVRVAGGAQATLGKESPKLSAAEQARAWFMSNYPLLGALAASFRIIEDSAVCRALEITIAAVDAGAREVYLNPNAALSRLELQFVMAHELLHVGLRHHARRKGRDPYLWNVACDYVINGWLIELGVGEMPAFGGLHDPQLKGLSAEAIYDQMATDLRRFRKLATLRGSGAGDMLERAPDWWLNGEGVALDDFYRGCLSRGLAYHEQQGRGYLPAGLLEEIRAIQQPAIPWDVELAQWLDAFFRPVERRRTYARPSRRQSSTPDVPRPSWHVPEELTVSRTFGVVIDTSGSMERRVLAMGLGAIASYAASRQVDRVRVVFCDAAAYDAGYMAPEAIADRVQVRGRGGTVLRPGIVLLEGAEDFPKGGPILIITDGQCDRLEVKRQHAYLLPQGRRLPFPARGPVFEMSRAGTA